MAEFSVTEAQLVSLFLASIFYGIYFSTFCDCLRALIWNGSKFRATANVKWILLVVAVLMFVCETTDAIFNLEHNLEAFIRYSKGPAAQFKIINHWTNIGRGITFALTTMLGDAMLIYRCWAVWGRHWWITILPAMLWCAMAISFCAVPYVEAKFVGGNATLTAASINVWTTCSCVTTFVLNIITTSLIAFKIWSVSRSTSSMTARTVQGRTPLEQAMRIIIESGLIYTASVCILLATSLAKHNAIYPVSHCVRQVGGICFNLIIVRVDWLRTSGSTHSTGAGVLSGASHVSSSSRGGNKGALSGSAAAAQRGSTMIPLHFLSQPGVVSHHQGVEVTVSRTHHVDEDDIKSAGTPSDELPISDYKGAPAAGWAV